MPPRRSAAARGLASGSRERLLTAAAAEFAARGVAGGRGDRLARTARVNKAMIYYHFKSKAGLYREILRDMFAAVGARVTETGRSPASPADKVRAFVEAIAAEAEARPHFPPIWFREIADGGRHLDPETTGHITGIVKTLGAILAEGVAARRFRPVNPLHVHAGIVGPLLLYFASGDVRARLARRGIKGADRLARHEVVAHVQQVAIATLERHTP
jgi:AcrR family transcriptional regulator